MSKVPVHRMLSEEIFLLLPRILHWDILHDILLTPVHDADETQLERVCPSSEHVERIRTRVHEVDLAQYPKSPLATRIDGPGEFERIGVGEIYIGWGDRKNHSDEKSKPDSERRSADSRVWLRDIVQDEVLYLSLNIRRLIAHRDLCQSRKIHQREVQHARPVNLQVDGKL